jgi:thiol-disulfide isomerase/thioredoxin
METLISRPLSDRTPEGVEKHRTKLVEATAMAAGRILALEDAAPEVAARAAEIQLQLFMLSAEVGDAGAGERLQAFKQQLREDKRNLVRAVVLHGDLIERLAQWGELDGEAKQAWLASAALYLQLADPGRVQARLVISAAGAIDQFGDQEIAQALVNHALSAFRESKDEDDAELTERLEELARYLRLEGSVMKIEGRLLGGAPFEWSQYKDKVVLVDFWATWCGPCIAELPNVIENYKKYHGKGFEVVGISLDDETTVVEEFVARNDIHWPILVGTQSASGWSHPMAVKYGIHGIPAAILVGRDGKVISKHARGEDLGGYLQQILGEPLPVQEEHVSEQTPQERARGG